MHVGKWPKTDCHCLRHLLVRQRQGVPHAGSALRHPRLRHGAALPSVHAAGDGALAERAQAPDRLPGREDRQEAGLRPPEGDGAPVLPPHRGRPRDRRSRRPCADADVRRMLRRRAAGAATDVRNPGGRGLPGIAEGGARGTRRQRCRRRQAGAFPGDLERFHPVLGHRPHGLHAAEVRRGLGDRGAAALARARRTGCSIRTIPSATSPTGPSSPPATASTRLRPTGPGRSSSRPASSRRTGRSSTTTGAASRPRASARWSATN